jgi:hypothetical protein
MLNVQPYPFMPDSIREIVPIIVQQVSLMVDEISDFINDYLLATFVLG